MSLGCNLLTVMQIYDNVFMHLINELVNSFSLAKRAVYMDNILFNKTTRISSG